jgi:SAM-dependent methyltransferase
MATSTAQGSNVSIEISPLDTMFEGSSEHYFSVGQSALHCIRLGLLGAGKNDPHNILDFACGFGRVLRVLRATFPTAKLTACDISANAVGFCSKAFGAQPVQSSEEFSDLKFDDTFDLIWCGSLLTQLIPAQFGSCLELFQSLLSPGGVMVFTTHGPFVAERIRRREFNYGLHEDVCAAMIADYDRCGYGYGDYPDHVLPQVGVKRYGVSIAKPSWIADQVERRPDLRLVNFTERAWDNHQDSVACMNEKGL